MKELIKQLTQIPGPSGYESAIRETIREIIKPHVRETRVDAMGNLIAQVGTKAAGGMRVMIAAHMDEIGLIVSHIEKKGLVRFSNLGGVLPRYLAGGRVVFLNGTRGVINSDRHDEVSKIQPISQFFIDIGAISEKDCPVKIGDLAVFDREFLDLGKRVSSKALDDRCGCALMIETIQRVKQSPHELLFVFCTQEEVGSRGATTAAYQLDADLGIALDVTPVGDILGVKMQVNLGEGPAIKVRDVGHIADPAVVNWMVRTARELKVPHQLEVLDVGSTDARAMQISRGGMPSGALSIPCRYVHSPSEMIDMDDYAHALTLLTGLLSREIKLEKK